MLSNGWAPDTIWAYAYLIVPPPARSRLMPIKTILNEETPIAHDEGRLWTGRLVPERLVTWILVVSDTARQDLSVNLLVAAELDRLGVEFIVTASLAVPREPVP